jgi:glycosyltransferase involved in cell wall biosynthesis
MGRPSVLRDAEMTASENSPALVSSPSPLRPLPEEDLIRMWGGSTEPELSIICASFNHVRFVTSALDGFLGQMTDFPFEVIVRDDASSDGTADVIREYAARYPRVMRCIFEPENTFSRGVSMIPPLLRAARGRFIASCASDDYWTDPCKLARQVATLRSAPDASMCFHDISTVSDVAGRQWPGLPSDLPERISPEELCLPSGWFPMPLTWVFRRSACDWEAAEFDRIVNEDNLMLSQFARFGPAICLPDRMAAYRLHGNSMYSSKSERQQRLLRLNSFLWIGHYHFRTGCPALGRRFSLEAARLAATELRTFGRKSYFWSGLSLAWVMVDPLNRLRLAVRRLHGSR